MSATPTLSRVEIAALAVPSVLLVAAAARGVLPLPMTEVLGFVTGGICVWLVVREHMWNWPIGLANNVFFAILFFRARLYADMALQGVYFGLGAWGWVNWARGATDASPLRVTRAGRGEWIGLAVFIPAATWGLRELLVVVQGAAPFWDAFTTALSLGAQYLQVRKRLESWWLWIAADVVYVPLYVSRGLPLTAVLYGVFLVMCFAGLRQWRQSEARGVPLAA